MGTDSLTREQSAELREKAFATGDRASSLRVYRVVHKLIRLVLHPLLRVRWTGSEVLETPGPLILAPVHRSHLDSVLVATTCRRRIRALGKESLFTVPVLSFFCAALGAIPVRRGQADREALAAAKALLDRGEAMIVFPEGGRQNGHDIAELFDGAAWLAARTGAKVVPIGISGTGEAMPEGAKMIRRSTVGIVVGELMDPPVGATGKRANRDDMRAFTDQLAVKLAEVQEQARNLASR
ncbi:MAG: lysophospholipid acyltransferase family protein [Acidimicrobiales bacterium]